MEINEKGELVGKQMPLSDDGIAHNSYFGMTYTVSFTLDEGYCGPLNYMFYGDDDMWVYLDGKLVADIGGVHSSVGIFVDFWEYIDPADTDMEHTIQIFYTERGASGSSCFMQFTIPQVQKVTPVSPVMDLVIDKTVLAEDEEAAGSDTFEFEISLRDENGDSYGSAYWFYVLDENDEQVSSTLVPAGTESVRAQMKDGYKIVIPSIPVGSQYSISEITSAEKLDEELERRPTVTITRRKLLLMTLTQRRRQRTASSPSRAQPKPSPPRLPALLPARTAKARTGCTLPTSSSRTNRSLSRNLSLSRIRKIRLSLTSRRLLKTRRLLTSRIPISPSRRSLSLLKPATLPIWQSGSMSWPSA